MTRTLLLALAASVALPTLAATHATADAPRPTALLAQASPQERAVVLTGAERRAALESASRSLNALKRVEGQFVQLAPSGRSDGRFWLERPGRMRLEYAPPSPLTVVADGRDVAVADRDLKTVDRAPLRSTPLYIVLKNDLNLARDARITDVRRIGGETQITARDRDGQTDGQITLVFDGPQLKLSRWRIVDGQGAATDLFLENLRPVAQIPAARFVAPRGIDPTR